MSITGKKRAALFGIALACAMALSMPMVAWGLTGGESDELAGDTEQTVVAPDPVTPKVKVYKNTKTIEITPQFVYNGTYVIESANEQGRVLNTKKATAANAKVVKKAAKAQKWIFTYDYSTNSYTILSAKNKKALTLSGSSKVKLQKLNKRRTPKTQRWTIAADAGGYIIKSLAKPKVALNITGKLTVVAKKVKDTNANQFVRIYAAKQYKPKSSINNGTYALYNFATKTMLQLKDNKRVTGTPLDLGKNNGLLSQKYEITVAGTDTYKIVSSAADRAVAVDSKGNIVLAAKSASKNQKWIAEKQDNGGFLFKNVSTGKYLTSQADGSVLGNVDKATDDTAANQYWMVLPTVTGLNAYQTRALGKANNPRESNTSSVNYFLCIDKTAHHLMIWKRESLKGMWTLLKDWRCSTSMHGGPYDHDYYKKTAKAKYPRQDHVLENNYTYGAKYWSSLANGTSIHSTLYMYHSEAPKDRRLGYSISGGCTRLALANAKWVYDYLPYYTGYANYYK